VADLHAIGRRARGETGDPSQGTLAAGRELGIYVHFPFCSVHCPYCDFAVDARPSIPHEEYADAVVAELEARAAWFTEAGAGPVPPLRSIYFGGGTPGLWRPQALARVIEAVERLFGGGRSALEITVEANPGEVDGEGLRAFRAAGVNRLSLGMQSDDDRLLAELGRNHRAPAAAAAMGAARAAGFDNISLDLMFGLPGQTLDGWRRTVDAVLALAPDHVSAYALTIERGTVFGARARQGLLVVPDDDAVAPMQEFVRDALAGAGFTQYEVSSHARPGRRAVHNSLYWTGAVYLGVGASAASFRALADGTAWRFTNPRATDTYLRAARVGQGSPAPALVEHRASKDLENEAVWLALRTADGIDRAAHRARFGLDPLTDVPGRQAAANECEALGYLLVEPNRIRPTPLGFLFADEIATRLWRS